MISILTESLDRTKQSRDANFALLATYAKCFEGIINQFHVYKQKHISDVAAWHRSYRTQLAEAREENSRLREQMWDMQEHASRANDLIREFRKKMDEDEPRWKRRVEAKARKQELRFWKRMAMPDLDENDPDIWSDDDDIIDPAEKERLKRVERDATEQSFAGRGSQQSEDSDEEAALQLQTPLRAQQTPSQERVVGGYVAPGTPHSRAASTGSSASSASTGSTGNRAA